MRDRLGFVAIALSVVWAGCGSDQLKVVRVDSDGVAIVTNSGTPPELSLGADTVALLGGDETGPGSFYRVRAPLVDVDGAGRIYVLDPGRHRVTAFDSETRHIGTFGREGEGPGELSAPLSIAVSSTGAVTVHDAGRGRLVTYAADGSLLREEAAPYTVINIGFRQFEVTSSGVALWIRDRFQTPDATRFDRLALIESADTVDLITGRSSYSSTAYHSACQTTFTIRLPLSPQLYWAQQRDRLAVVAWPEFRIDLFEGGVLSRRISLGEPGEDLSESGAVALIGARGVRGPCNVGPRDLVAMHGFFPRPQSIAGITFGPDDELWVLDRAMSAGGRIVAFDSTGAVLGVLPERFPMPLAFLPDGRALIQVVDSLDVERVGIVMLRR